MSWVANAVKRVRSSVWIPVVAVIVLGIVLTLSLSSSRGLKGGVQHLGEFFDRGGRWEWRMTDARGELRYVRRADGSSRVQWNGDTIPLDSVTVEDDLITLTDVRDDEGHLLYDRVPLTEEASRRLRAIDPERRLGVRFAATVREPGHETSIRLLNVGGGEPAANAGLHAGDVITAIEGQPEATEASLRRALGPRIPGGALQVTVRRGTKTLTVELALPSLLPLDDWRKLAEDAR
ncbi:MAG: PDZ domain-containing protein [Planctomycetes bacterium]|nr:PDZ domain-containing protein [Planctomycetota bacterium]MBI3847810.1 PDZ domain-containing protein [Planctomycetota bacterium]